MTDPSLSSVPEQAAPESPSLVSVSLSRIKKGDLSETGKMLQACAGDGGFYLSLCPEDGTDFQRHPLLVLADNMFETARETFSLPLKEKMHWEMDLWGDLQIGG